MLGRVGNRLGHAFPDCNRGNDNNELASAVTLTQLEDGLDVKFRFKIQSYQTEAVKALADCFDGQPLQTMAVSQRSART